MTQCPKHIAIIPDGNGRWATERQQPRVSGHKRGAERLKTIISHALSFPGIKALTIFGFSTENQKRPATEISFIMRLIRSELASISDEMNEKNIRLRFVGDRTCYPKTLLADIEAAENKTQHHTGLTVTIALHYSGRWDIAQAVQKEHQLLTDGHLSASDIKPGSFTHFLSLHDLPEPELLIRTSGEQRISNFCLWQLAYTELYFTECFWPDFDTDHFDKAVAFFQSRQRRFGNITPQESYS